ncbi:MAG: hypothetical protein ACOZB0_04715 [Pseudomonadota bacterium]
MTHPFFTPERDRMLIEMRSTHRVEEIAAVLGCSMNTVYRRLRDKRMQGTGPDAGWTAQDEAEFERLWPTMTVAALAAHFGRSDAGIRWKRVQLGLPPKANGHLKRQHDQAAASAARPIDETPEPDEPVGGITVEEIQPGHRWIRFGSNAPKSHGLSVGPSPRRACSLWNLYA